MLLLVKPLGTHRLSRTSSRRPTLSAIQSRTPPAAPRAGRRRPARGWQHAGARFLLPKKHAPPPSRVRLVQRTTTGPGTLAGEWARGKAARGAAARYYPRATGAAAQNVL